MELADKLYVSFQAVSNWERGQSMPDVSKLPVLCKELNVSLEDLIHNKEVVEQLKDVSNFKENNHLTNKNNITSVASMIKPSQLEKILKSNPICLTIEEIKETAPFLSKELVIVSTI